MSKPLLDYHPETEFLPTRTIESGHETTPGRGLALAAELLEVSSEAELQSFLSDLVGRALDAGHALPATPRAHALKRAVCAGLWQAAHAALPIGPGPLVGPLIDALGRSGPSALKQRAARVFGLELEGLSPEDKEFELAQRFVRFADAAAAAALSNAAQLAATPPAQLRTRAHALAQAAMVPAARRYAPGLLRCCASAGPRPPPSRVR
jgi:hypothetical protein